MPPLPSSRTARRGVPASGSPDRSAESWVGGVSLMTSGALCPLRPKIGSRTDPISHRPGHNRIRGTEMNDDPDQIDPRLEEAASRVLDMEREISTEEELEDQRRLLLALVRT